MKNDYKQAIEILRKTIDDNKDTTKYFKILKIIVNEQYKEFKNNNFANYQPYEIERTKLMAKFKGVDEDTITTEDASTFIAIKNIQEKLNILTSSDEKTQRQFEEIGLYPKLANSEDVGRGKVKKIALTFVVTDKIVSNSTADKNHSNFSINYSREDTKNIGISWLMKPFFKESDFKLKTRKGYIFMSLLALSFLMFISFILLWIVIVYHNNLKSLNSWFSIFFTFICIFGYPIFFYMTWYENFLPIHRIIEHKIVKAPSAFLNSDEYNAELEIFRETEEDTKNNDFAFVRITRYISTCPICSAPIELRTGKPDHNLPLVGRCKEAPHAHVYTFDRMTMKGYFLGHDGYLQND